MKKVVALILSLILILSSSISVLAAKPEENVVSPYYVTIAGIIPMITEENGDLYASISVVTSKTCSVEITMSIERSAHGTSWSTYRSYPKVTLTSGHTRGTEEIAYDVPGGYYYRTYGTIKVYVNGTLTDSETVESDPVYVSIL